MGLLRRAQGALGGGQADDSGHRGEKGTPKPWETWSDSLMLQTVACWARAFRGALPMRLPPPPPRSPRCHHLPSDPGTGCSQHCVRLPGGLKPDLPRPCTRG